MLRSNGNLKYIGFIISICLVIATGSYVSKYRDNLYVKFASESSGRVGAWQEIYKDFSTPPLPKNTRKFTITGFGPGAFEYTHSIRKNYRWWQAHNEYLETLYNHGILGVVVLILAGWTMIEEIKISNERTRAVEATLVSIAILAAGTFVLRIWPITLILAERLTPRA